MSSSIDAVNSAVYRDPAQPIEARVSDLLGRMTLEEKLAQLGSVWVYELLSESRFDSEKARPLLLHGIGQITRVAGASSLKPADAAAVANRIQRLLVEETRLGIPAIVHEECCSGYMARDATCFPQIIGLASCWEPELVEAMALVVRKQMRAAGAHQGLSPVLDVTRDPRWGRVEETFGEDPYLVGRLGVAFVQGLQGKDLRAGVMATAKHLVGYGAPEGGMNWAPPHLPDRELHEVYLFPFEAAIKVSGLQSVMNAYNELDGVPCAASEELLRGILRERWGFEGLVVSDYFAVESLRDPHCLTEDPLEAAALALTAGIDVELPSTDLYGNALRCALEEGRVPQERVEEAVARVLRAKFRLGLFENPYVDAESAPAHFDTPEHRSLARRIARKSMVLLKNEGEILPLSPDLPSVAIIGPHADSTRLLIGDYAYPCHVESLRDMTQGENIFNMPVPDHVDLVTDFVPMRSILAALLERFPGMALRYARGCEVTGEDRSGFAEAIEAARNAGVALLFVGGKSGLIDDCTCGEARDRMTLDLPGLQGELVREIVATGTPTVVVLISGRPLAIPWMAEHVPAILHAWLPGEEGADAVVDVLFGEVSPGGKLPISVPRDAGQVPVYYRHKPTGGRSYWKGAYADGSNKPLWPFGHGLSYTRFHLDNLRPERREMGPGEHLRVSVEVENCGERAGEEVVQLYTRDLAASVTRPVKELQGFKRIFLQPGERRMVTFTLYANQFGFFDRRMRYVLEPGDIRIMVGTSSESLPLESTIRLTGRVTEIGRDKVFFSDVTVSEQSR